MNIKLPAVINIDDNLSSLSRLIASLNYAETSGIEHLMHDYIEVKQVRDVQDTPPFNLTPSGWVGISKHLLFISRTHGVGIYAQCFKCNDWIEVDYLNSGRLCCDCTGTIAEQMTA